MLAHAARSRGATRARARARAPSRGRLWAGRAPSSLVPMASASSHTSRATTSETKVGFRSAGLAAEGEGVGICGRGTQPTARRRRAWIPRVDAQRCAEREQPAPGWPQATPPVGTLARAGGTLAPRGPESASRRVVAPRPPPLRPDGPSLTAAAATHGCLSLPPPRVRRALGERHVLRRVATGL